MDVLVVFGSTKGPLVYFRVLPGLALGALLLMSGCSTPDRASESVPAAASPAVADAAFVRMMLAFHQHSLPVLALADTRAADSQVKELAARAAQLQRLQQATMTTLLAGWAQPTAVADTPDAHLGELAALTGSSFDRALIQTMIIHNDQAVDAARQALTQPLSDKTRSIATAVDRGLSAENAALRSQQARLAPTSGLHSEAFASP